MSAPLSYSTAAEVERARNVMDRVHQRPSAYARAPSAEAESIEGTPPRLARGAGLSKQTGRAALSQGARSMNTSLPDPPRSSNKRKHNYVMQFDGSSRRNPGPSGAGAVLYRCAKRAGWPKERAHQGQM